MQGGHAAAFGGENGGSWSSEVTFISFQLPSNYHPKLSRIALQGVLFPSSSRVTTSLFHRLFLPPHPPKPNNALRHDSPPLNTCSSTAAFACGLCCSESSLPTVPRRETHARCLFSVATSLSWKSTFPVQPIRPAGSSQEVNVECYGIVGRWYLHRK